MTRQLEAAREVKQAKLDKQVLFAIEGGLSEAVSRAGGELTGLGVNLRGGDCLLVIKAVLAGKRQIAFVGAADLPNALVKAMREGNADKLAWRADKYG